MASKPPPIIRSTKAFSVEIPEGSKSAKSRRSDVVPGEELEIHRKSSNFHELEIASSADFQLPNSDIPDRLASLDHTSVANNQTHQEHDSQSNNLQRLNQANRTATDNGQTVTAPNHKDQFAQEEKGSGLKYSFAHETQQPIKDNLPSFKTEGLKDRLAKEKQEPLKDNLQSVHNNGAVKDNFANEKQDTLKDNLQPVNQDALASNDTGLHATDSLQDQNSGMAKEAIKDRNIGLPDQALEKQPTAVQTSNPLSTQNPGIPTDGLDSNLQAIPDDSGSNNQQALPDTKLADNMQGLEDDTLADNLQSVELESEQDNRQNIADGALKDNTQSLEQPTDKDQALPVNTESVEDNLQGLPDQALDNNLQGLPDETLKDNLQGLPDQAMDDNRQALGDEALNNHVTDLAIDPYAPDANAGIAKSPLSDEEASIPVEGVHTRSDSTEKDHVQDHVVALPESHQTLRPGPSPVLGGTYSSSEHAAPKLSGNASAIHPASETHSAPASAPNISKAEQAKRAEAFHSRVQAIRKSVSGINHLLDDLQDKP